MKCKFRDEDESTDPGGPQIHRYYFTASGELAAWKAVGPSTVSFANIQPLTQPFSVCSVQAPNSQPLMRVEYTFPTGQNAHDELVAGKSRFDLARCQGNTNGSCANVNHSLWSIRYSGITAATQIVVEALEDGCPYPGGLWGTSLFAGGKDPFGGGFSPNMDPIFTLSKIQSLSAIGEAYLNGQYDGNPTPRPIARTVLNVAPQTRPPMDFSSDFLNKPETFTEVLHKDGTPDCGIDSVFPDGVQKVFPNDAQGCQSSHRFTSATYDSIMFGQDSYKGAIGMSQGELITTGGNTWTAPIDPPQATISATDDSDFLHVALEVNGYSTDRRYPQITISDHGPFQEQQWYLATAPVDTPSGAPFPDGDQQNTLILSAIEGPGPLMLFELCHNRGWQPNAQCPYFLLERSGTNLVNAKPPQSSNAHQDINNTMQEDTPIRWDLYVSNDRAYFYANSKPYGCVRTSKIVGIKSGDATPFIPTGDVVVAFGDRMYHPQAEVGEVCSTNTFLCKHSNIETIRRYDYFGYSSHHKVTLNSNGVFSVGPSAMWDEGVLPCNSVIFDTNQNGGTLSAEQ